MLLHADGQLKLMRTRKNLIIIILPEWRSFPIVAATPTCADDPVCGESLGIPGGASRL